jgi:hypothetical protein
MTDPIVMEPLLLFITLNLKPDPDPDLLNYLCP